MEIALTLEVKQQHNNHFFFFLKLEQWFLMSSATEHQESNCILLLKNDHPAIINERGIMQHAAMFQSHERCLTS